jgi:hypothetical protein
MPLVNRHRHGVHLLHEPGAERLAQRAGARSGDENADVLRRNRGELVADGDQQLRDLLGLAGFVPLIVGPDDRPGLGIDGDRLDRRRSDVEADDEVVAGQRGAGRSWQEVLLRLANGGATHSLPPNLKRRKLQGTQTRYVASAFRRKARKRYRQ